MLSPRFKSPVRRRQHGGRRPGAGRKKKWTPIKKEQRFVVQLKRRRKIRAKWIKTRKELVRLTKSAEFGEEYERLKEEYLRLGKKIGQGKAKVQSPNISEESESSTDADQDSHAESSDDDSVFSDAQPEVNTGILL